MAGLRAETERIEIKPGTTNSAPPAALSALVHSGGRLLNLGNATRHPSFIMSASFANQVLAQTELHCDAWLIAVPSREEPRVGASLPQGPGSRKCEKRAGRPTRGRPVVER